MSIEENKEARHKARQQKVKEQVDAKIAAAQEEKGLLLIITGNGKGKSTSGFGTIARAVGHGLTAAVVQYIKGTWTCGERTLLENAGVSFDVMATGFTWNTQDKTEEEDVDKEDSEETFKEAEDSSEKEEDSKRSPDRNQRY